MDTSTEKAEAVTRVVALVESGMTANKAAEELATEFDVSPRTIKRWAFNAGHPLGVLTQDTAKKAREIAQVEYEARRLLLRNQMLQVAEDLLSRIDQPHYDYRGKDSNKVHFDVAPSGASKDYVTAAAILVDKMRLEEGKSSGKFVVSVEDARSVLDAEIIRLEQELGINDMEET